MDLICIARNIRKVRTGQNITVEQLAKRSSFSKGFISQVENFRVTPSLNALSRIADALGVPPGELFSHDAAAPEFTFGTLSDGEEMIRDNSIQSGMRYFALAYRQIGRRVNPFIVEYTPPAMKRDFLMHDTEEFFVLLEGSLDFCVIDEAHSRRMGPSDTLYMKANIPHRALLAENCTYARALIVYS